MHNFWLSVKAIGKIKGIFRSATCPASPCQVKRNEKEGQGQAAEAIEAMEDSPLTDLPDDLRRIIAILAKSNEWERGRGTGNLNVLRLVSKGHQEVVELRTTSLTYREYGQVVLPLDLLSRCKGLLSLNLWSGLRSLDGLSLHCPGLKRLCLSQGGLIDDLKPLSKLEALELLRISPASNITWRISDLDPLASCTRLKKVQLPKLAEGKASSISISALASLVNLEVFECPMRHESSIEDLSPLSRCSRIKVLDITGGNSAVDLTPLSSLKELEELHIGQSISLSPLSCCTSLHTIEIVYNGPTPPNYSLDPLSSLTNLQQLYLRRVDDNCLDRLSQEVAQLKPKIPSLRVTCTPKYYRRFHAIQI